MQITDSMLNPKNTCQTTTDDKLSKLHKRNLTKVEERIFYIAILFSKKFLNKTNYTVNNNCKFCTKFLKMMSNYQKDALLKLHKRYLAKLEEYIAFINGSVVLQKVLK